MEITMAVLGDLDRYPTEALSSLSASNMIPKSIRSLLMTVFAIACFFGLLWFNWGLVLAIAAFAPLAYGLRRLNAANNQSRVLTFVLLLGGCLLAYIFSPGPFVGVAEVSHATLGTSGPMNDVFNYIYRPHLEFCTGRYASEVFNRLFTDYIVQWQLLCRPALWG